MKRQRDTYDRIVAVGEESVRAAARPTPARACGVKIPLRVASAPDGRCVLVGAGGVVSPCASPDVAARTRDFFA